MIRCVKPLLTDTHSDAGLGSADTQPPENHPPMLAKQTKTLTATFIDCSSIEATPVSLAADQGHDLACTANHPRFGFQLGPDYTGAEPTTLNRRPSRTHHPFRTPDLQRMSNPPPDTVRKPLDLRAFLLMMFLCVVWGFQQVAMKAVSGDIAPVMQLSLRFSCAAVFFAVLVLRSEGMRWFEDGTLPSGVLLGVLFSLEFLLLGSALQHTSAAHAVVFLYSAPVFTAVGVQFLPEERMGPEQWWGMAIAFGGIAVAFFESGNRPWAEILKGDFLALLAGAAWGASNVVLRRGRISRASTVKTVCYQVAIAGVLLGLYASTTAQNQITWSLASISAVVFQTVIISIISYLIWFWLLRHYLTSRLMLFSLLTPLIGVFFGAAFLGDRLEAQFGAGALLVLAGILLVNRRVLFARAK